MSKRKLYHNILNISGYIFVGASFPYVGLMIADNRPLDASVLLGNVLLAWELVSHNNQSPSGEGE